MEFKVGDKILDPVSELEGIVIARTVWYGCTRFLVQPFGSKDGKPYETFSIDEPQAQLVPDAKPIVEATPESHRHGAWAPDPERH